MAVTIESVHAFVCYLGKSLILFNLSPQSCIYPRNRIAYKLLGLSSINDIERKLVRADRWTVTTARSKRMLKMYVLTRLKSSRKKDNNCRYGYVNESAQQSEDDYSLVIRNVIWNLSRIPITLSVPSLLTLSSSWERNNKLRSVSFCGREKGARSALD